LGEQVLREVSRAGVLAPRVQAGDCSDVRKCPTQIVKLGCSLTPWISKVTGCGWIHGTIAPRGSSTLSTHPDFNGGVPWVALVVKSGYLSTILPKGHQPWQCVKSPCEAVHTIYIQCILHTQHLDLSSSFNSTKLAKPSLLCKGHPDPLAPPSDTVNGGQSCPAYKEDTGFTPYVRPRRELWNLWR